MQSFSFLLIRLSSLGDVILTAPLVHALREKYPGARIDFVVRSEYCEAVQLIPGITQIHTLDRAKKRQKMRLLHEELRAIGYDYVLDLQNNLRSRFLRQRLGAEVTVIRKRTLRRWLLVRFKINLLKGQPDVIGRYFETARSVGVIDTGAAPSLNVGSGDESFHSNPIALVPGSRHWNKRWPAMHFVELATALIARGHSIEIYGSPEEAELCQSIALQLPARSVRNFAGELSMKESAEKIARCSAAVTNDSGFMHLASAVGIPTYSIFGATVTDFGFAPRAESSHIIENEALHCRPCTAIGGESCPETHFKCMIAVRPNDVFLRMVENAEAKPSS